MNKHLKTILPLLFLVMITASCSEDSEPTPTTETNTDHAYMGDWDGTFTGDDSGTWKIEVDKDGAFTGLLFSDNGQSTHPIDSGTITKDGVFDAKIDVNGTILNFEGNGISSDSAKGTWGNQSAGLTGTWNGAKD